jgi:hypothetical protein
LSSDDVLFREIDEDVRRDQMANLWKRYGKAVIGVAFGVIIAVSGLKAYEYWRVQQAEAAARNFFAAAALNSEDKPEEAAKAYAALFDEHDGYGLIARFGQAASLAFAGDQKAAVDAYDAIVAANNAPQELIAAAKLRAAWLLVDSASPADLEARLAGLDDANGPWRSVTREILGLAYYRTGDLAKADAILNELLADPEAPQQARARAQLLIGLMAPKLAKNAG